MQSLKFVGNALCWNTRNIFLNQLESRSLQNPRLYYREIRSYTRRIRSIQLEEALKYGRQMLTFNTFPRLVEDSMLSPERRAFASEFGLSHRERKLPHRVIFFSDNTFFTREKTTMWNTWSIKQDLWRYLACKISYYHGSLISRYDFERVRHGCDRNMHLRLVDLRESFPLDDEQKRDRV